MFLLHTFMILSNGFCMAVTTLKVNDVVDVLASDCQVYCPAHVVKITPDVVKVDYKGWNDGEVRCFSDVEDNSRIKRKGTYVTKSKAWVKIKNNVCYWPCVVYIRRPKNASGEQFLKDETNVYIEPFGKGRLFLRPYIKGVWVRATKVVPFAYQHDKKRESGLLNKRKDLAELFAEAWRMCESSDISAVNFEFDGTFECSGVKERAAAAAAMKVKKVKMPQSAVNRVPVITPDVDVTSMFAPPDLSSEFTLNAVKNYLTALQKKDSDVGDVGDSGDSGSDSQKKRPDVKFVNMSHLVSSLVDPTDSTPGLSTGRRPSRASATARPLKRRCLAAPRHLTLTETSA